VKVNIQIQRQAEAPNQRHRPRRRTRPSQPGLLDQNIRNWLSVTVKEAREVANPEGPEAIEKPPLACPPGKQTLSGRFGADMLR
jgi:hypothetical protein